MFDHVSRRSVIEPGKIEVNKNFVESTHSVIITLLSQKMIIGLTKDRTRG